MSNNNRLYDLYKDMENFDYEKYKWFRQNIPTIRLASKHGIALCGSVGINLSTNKYDRYPSDIDFVTDFNHTALCFISELIKKFERYKWFGRILIQNNTDFCLPGTSVHYKIKSSFGTNICVAVLKDKLNFWYTKDGVCVQSLNDMYKYNNIARDRDNKDNRVIIPIEPEETNEDIELVEDLIIPEITNKNLSKQ